LRWGIRRDFRSTAQARSIGWKHLDLSSGLNAPPGPRPVGKTRAGGKPPTWSETVDRAQKEQVVDELGQIFDASGVVVVARYEGMTVAEMQDLRAQMREAGGSVRVAKNRLAKIALDGKPCASIADYLTGMTVLAFSEDPVAAAKVADKFAKGND